MRKIIITISLALLSSWLYAAGEVDLKNLIQQAIDSPSRPVAERPSDKEHAPLEVLLFTQVKPGDKVGTIGSNSIYYLSMITNIIGEQGQVYPHNASWSVRDYPNVLANWRDRIVSAPIKNIEPIVSPIDQLPFPESLDLIIIDRFYHDVIRAHEGDEMAMNRAILKTLKPRGRYVVIDHHALPGTGIRDTDELHRVDAEYVRAQVLQAGFKFDAESGALNNKSDTRKRSARRSVQTDTDRFMLRFLKP